MITTNMYNAVSLLQKYPIFTYLLINTFSLGRVGEYESLFNYSITQTNYSNQNKVDFASQYYFPFPNLEIEYAARSACDPFQVKSNCASLISPIPFEESCMQDFIISGIKPPYFMSSFVAYAEICNLHGLDYGTFADT